MPKQRLSPDGRRIIYGLTKAPAPDWLDGFFIYRDGIKVGIVTRRGVRVYDWAFYDGSVQSDRQRPCATMNEAMRAIAQALQEQAHAT
jgi:hypothetical protein